MKAADTLYCIADERGFRLLRGNGGGWSRSTPPARMTSPTGPMP
jgi:hypothetical protein